VIMSLQEPLPLPLDLSARHPLLSAEVAMIALGLRLVDDVYARIGGAPRAGEALEWVWDIRAPRADRAEPRVFWRCLMGRRSTEFRALERMTEAAIYNEIFPSHWGRVKATRVYERWTCSEGHVTNLRLAGCFEALTDARRGPNGSPEFARASLVRWLKERRVA